MEVLRTGLVEADVSDAERGTADTVVALLRVFAKDALVVAGRYTHGRGQTVVTADAMRRGLMYCARTFFEQGDADLAARIAEETRAMEEEGEEEEEEEGEAEGEEEEEEEKEEEEKTTGQVTEEDVSLVKHVDAIAATWHLWVPEDPVFQLIKRAMDQTPVA